MNSYSFITIILVGALLYLSGLPLSESQSNDYLINFSPYNGAHCSGNMTGVGFGIKPFGCLVSLSNSMFVYPFFQSPQVNLSHHRGQYCDYYHDYQVFTMGSCAAREDTQGQSSYLTFKSSMKPPTKVPSNSVLQINFADSTCKQVQSYWYATNATSVVDDSTTYTYLCLQGKPYQQHCNPSQGCSVSPISSQCQSSTDYATVQCT
eukprot:gene3082-3853_t